MEATHARQMFPCMDEPRYKATFQLHVARKENFTALSNTPKVSRKEKCENELYASK